MKLLTKVARGVAFGDVSNLAVRNILTELSKKLYDNITEQEMIDTMEYFDWKCPYTGRDLKKALEDNDKSCATDHIYPQNRKWCGLNVKGNLVIVDKDANSAKRDADVEEFMKTDSKFWNNLGIDLPTRLQRLQKIKDFQKECGYDPHKIGSVISPILDAHYDYIRNEQEKRIDNTIDIIQKSDIPTPMKSPRSTTAKTTTSTSATTKTKRSKGLPELVFYPADEQQFKNELLRSKKAYFILTYESGAVKRSPWNLNSFDPTSNLRGNIQSRPFWRNKDKEGLIKVEVFID